MKEVEMTPEQQRRQKKWSVLEQESEQRKQKEEIGKGGGDVDMTDKRLNIALRALVESTAGLLLSVLSTPSGCRAALASASIVPNILIVAKKALSMVVEEGKQKQQLLRKMKKQYDTSMKKTKTTHLSEEKKLAALKENKLIQKELAEEEKQAIQLDYKQELVRLQHTNNTAIQLHEKIYLEQSARIQNTEEYGSRVFKVVLGCMWSLLSHAPQQEYPRLSHTKQSLMSHYAKMLVQIRFIDDLETIIRLPKLSVALRIFSNEFRSAILYANNIVQIIHGATHRDHQHKHHHHDTKLYLDDSHVTCQLLQLFLNDNRASMISYGAMGIAREAYKPQMRGYMTSCGDIIPRLIQLLEQSSCTRLDTYVLHAVMNVSAGRNEQLLLGTKETILLLLSCVEKDKNNNSGTGSGTIDYKHYDLYQENSGSSSGHGMLMVKQQQQQRTWMSNLTNPYYSHVLDLYSPHHGDQSTVYASRILSNVAKHSANRTVLYKIELQRAAAAATAASSNAPSVSSTVRRFDGSASPRPKFGKHKKTGKLRQQFDKFLNTIDANPGNEKSNRGSKTRSKFVPTPPLPSSSSPTSNARGTNENTLRKPMSAIWKEQKQQQSISMTNKKQLIFQGIENGTVGRTRFDTHQHRIVSKHHPSTRSIRSMPAMTLASRQHPRSKRWRPAIADINTVKEALQNTTTSTGEGTGGNPIHGTGTTTTEATDRSKSKHQFGSISLPTQKIDSVRKGSTARKTSSVRRASVEVTKISSGASGLTASDTTAIQLEPQSPRHTFKFRAATVDRILVICFEMDLHGYGSDGPNDFNDLVQRTFLKALRIRLDLDEDLAIGVHVATMKNGIMQHSPYRVHLHVSIEACDNGHDVAEQLMKDLSVMKDTDIGRDGHFSKKSNNQIATPIGGGASSPPGSPTVSPIGSPNGSPLGSPTGSPANGAATTTAGFIKIWKRELVKSHLTPPKSLQLLSMSTPHKAFEDAAIFGALDPDADVSLGLWKHVPGSTISESLFPKYTGPSGQEFCKSCMSLFLSFDFLSVCSDTLCVCAFVFCC